MFSEMVLLLLSFLLAFIAVICWILLRRRCKDLAWKKRYNKRLILFYVMATLIIFTGIRNLNPLRWPNTAIRVVMLNFITPVGMTWDEVHQRVEFIPGWRMMSNQTTFVPVGGIKASRLNRNSPYFVPWPEGNYIIVGAGGRRGYIGHTRVLLIIRRHIYPIWVFDEEGILIDVSIGGQLQL